MISNRMRRAILALALTVGAALGTLSMASPASATSWYQLRVEHSAQCLSVVGGYTYEGRAIQQEPCNQYAWQQQWTFVPTPYKDHYLLQVRHTGQCLDVYRSSMLHAASVVQWHCTGTPNQIWYFRPYEGAFRVIARHSGKCLDVRRGSTAPGAFVLQADCAYPGYHQRWSPRYVASS